MTNDFHFDTEIIIKLHHQGFRIREVPIPTYYGGEICYVNGFRYAKDVVRAVRRYRRTVRSVECFPEFREYFIHYPIKESRHSSHTYFLNAAGSNQDDPGAWLRRRILCGEAGTTWKWGYGSRCARQTEALRSHGEVRQSRLEPRLRSGYRHATRVSVRQDPDDGCAGAPGTSGAAFEGVPFCS